MYSFIIFVHVLSAVSLGGFLAYPFIWNSFVSQLNKDILVVPKVIMSYIRFGHYALVFTPVFWSMFNFILLNIPLCFVGCHCNCSISSNWWTSRNDS